MSVESRGALGVDGRIAAAVERPGSEGELGDLVARARRDRLALVPFGGRTALDIGNAPSRLDLGVNLGAFCAIGDHSVADMVVTAQAGVRLADLNAYLAQHGQRLPIDAPQEATLGGVVAAAQAGKRRLLRGTARDWLIGARAIAGDGRWVKAGAKVVKNVAGYDLLKLLVASFGTLAIMTELTFKIAPRPQAQAAWLGTFEDPGAVQPLVATARTLSAAWIEGRGRPGGSFEVEVGFEGEAEAVEWQSARLVEQFGQLRAFEPDRLLGVPDRPLEPDMTERCRFVLATLPDHLLGVLERCSAAGSPRVHAHLASGLARLSSADCEEALPLWIREVEAAGGWWRLERGPKAARECFGPQRAEWALGREIKRLFDPDGILAPGRAPGEASA